MKKILIACVAHETLFYDASYNLTNICELGNLQTGRNKAPLFLIR